MTMRGIDVSAHQGAIDWKKVKADGIRFAIIRAGYGNSITQKDACFDKNIKEAQAVGIKCGAYWFSYATSEEDARKEATVFRQVLKGHKLEFPVYFDFEYDSVRYAKEQGVTVTKAKATAFAKAFLEEMTKAGYLAGNYTNLDFFNNYFDDAKLKAYPLWLAAWGSTKPGGRMGIWQYADNGTVSGITGSSDMDYAYVDYEKTIKEKGLNGFAKTDGSDKEKPAKDQKVNVTYRVKTQKYGWLPAVKNLEDYAGYENSPITDVAVKVSKGKVSYRVHNKGGGWLPKVTGYSIADPNNGYAGSGQVIDAVEIYYETPGDIRPYKKAKYRTAPLNGGYYSWQYDDEKTDGQDGYAGAFGTAIGKLQIDIV